MWRQGNQRLQESTPGDLEVGALVVEVATPVALLSREYSGTIWRRTTPVQRKNRRTDPQVIGNKGESIGYRNYATPEHKPDDDDMMDRLGEEAINSVAKEVRHRTTVPTMDIGDVQPVEREKNKYDGDTQKRGKGRTESKHHHSETETSQTAKAPSPNRPKT
jgi:hypothetical protein